MLWIVVLFLGAAMLATRRSRGPVWAMSLAWLACLAPIVGGAVVYAAFDDREPWYAFALIAFVGCYFAGAGMWMLLPRKTLQQPSAGELDRGFVASHASARIAWWLALAGTSCIVIDFAVSGGAGLDDLAALRETVVEQRGASLLVQIGSILTWACLYCFIFALVFRSRLSTTEFIRMLVPIGGYFLLSVFSAGRQAAFQVMIVTLLAMAVERTRRGPAIVNDPKRGSWSGAALALGVVALMSAYMGYVAVARNDNAVSSDKGEVIAKLFNVRLGDWFATLISSFGAGVHSACIEAIVYFSHSIVLFQNFLTVRFPDVYLGAMSFPFVFRQVQGVTGITTSAILADKVSRLGNTGVIGVGWTTAISSYIQDYGTLGAGVFLILLGYYSMSAWMRARVSADLNEVVIGIVVLLIAIYTPLIPASSDTNIFFLWLVAFGLTRRHFFVTPTTRAASINA